MPLAAVRPHRPSQTLVWELTVFEDHNFTVGTATHALLVHNGCRKRPYDPATKDRVDKEHPDNIGRRGDNSELEAELKGLEPSDSWDKTEVSGAGWDNTPNPDKWRESGGSIYPLEDGRVVYQRPDGVSVAFSPEGYPDFSPYAEYVVELPDGFHPDRTPDYQAANEALGTSGTKPGQWGSQPPEGFAWHHSENGTTMQLLPTGIHNTGSGGFSHAGGISVTTTGG